jgi:hypothetical protein
LKVRRLPTSIPASRSTSVDSISVTRFTDWRDWKQIITSFKFAKPPSEFCGLPLSFCRSA